MQLKNLKTVLVYDKVNTFGGAERVLLALHELFPRAPLYTSVYDPKKAIWAKVFPRVMTSFLQRWPLATTHVQGYVPLMPLVFETLNLNDYELVISVTSGEAKGVVTKPGTVHFCYCLTPTRYLWVDPGYENYQHFGLLNPLVNMVKKPWLSRLRLWDQAAAARPDAYATISETVARRIEKFYHREAEVIYPPVDTEVFKPAVKPRELNRSSTPEVKLVEPYFLLVARLVPYKKVELAIEVFRQLNLPLKIVGAGPDLVRLKSMINHGPTGGTRRGAFRQRMINHAPTTISSRDLIHHDPSGGGRRPLVSTIKLLGQVSEGQLLELYQNCRALIMPQEEDFGLVALEAMACGKPVIAYGRGGARETVVEGKTGMFFEEQSVESLAKAMKEFIAERFSARACRQQAEKFSLDKFKVQMRKWVASSLREHQNLTV
jgi:glycosyltransferase involved in cell wall biosynthesis